MECEKPVTHSASIYKQKHDSRFMIYKYGSVGEKNKFPLSWHAINSPTGNNSIWIDHWGRCYATFYRWLWNIFFIYLFLLFFHPVVVDCKYDVLVDLSSYPDQGPNLAWILLFKGELCANFQVSRYYKFLVWDCWVDFRLSRFNRHSKISSRGMSKPDRWS